jgi:hypothetical protein
MRSCLCARSPASRSLPQAMKCEARPPQQSAPCGLFFHGGCNQFEGELSRHFSCTQNGIAQSSSTDRSFLSESFPTEISVSSEFAWSGSSAVSESQL